MGFDIFNHVVLAVTQLGITFVAIAGVAWAVVKFGGKKWVDLYFDKWREEHKQELADVYNEKQESFKQSLQNYYNEKQESFKQALSSSYNKEIETHKAENQQQVERVKGIISEGLEGTKAGHQLDLEKTKLELDKRRQFLAAEVGSRMEALKVGLDLNSKTRLSISERRLDPYRSLWSLTEPLSPQSSTSLDRPALETAFRKWYYAFGNGLFLTWEAQDAYLLATGLLGQKVADVPDATIRDAFSVLRTQMKVDIAVYTSQESDAQVG
jgi:hypothetical protein